MQLLNVWVWTVENSFPLGSQIHAPKEYSCPALFCFFYGMIHSLRRYSHGTGLWTLLWLFEKKGAASVQVFTWRSLLLKHIVAKTNCEAQVPARACIHGGAHVCGRVVQRHGHSYAVCVCVGVVQHCDISSSEIIRTLILFPFSFLLVVRYIYIFRWQ